MIRKTIHAARKTAAVSMTIAGAFNPLSYRNVIRSSLLSAISNLLCVLIAAILISGALAIPGIISFKESAAKQLSQFDKFTIKTEIATKSPIETNMANDVDVYVNTTIPANAPESDIIISSAELRAKPLPCIIIKGMCSLFGNPYSIPINEMDISKNSEKTSRALMWAMLLVLPGILILLYLLLLVKYAAISLALAIVSYALLKLARRSLGLWDTLKITIVASTALLAMDVASFFLHIPGIIPFAGYAVLVTAAIAFAENDERAGRA